MNRKIARKRKPERTHDEPREEASGRDTSSVTGLGINTRGHRILRDLQAFLVPILAAILLQSLTYLAFVARAGPQWQIALPVVGMLALVPILSAITLSAFRRLEAPIIAAVVIVATYFSFVVTVVSALRIPVGFTALAAVLPVTMAVMAIGNIRFHQRRSTRVALIAFDGDDVPLSLLGRARISRITDPGASIAAYDTILIEPRQHHTPEWSSLLSRCHVSGVDIMPWALFLEIRQGRVHIPEFEVSSLSYTPSQMLYARSKRMLDLLAVIVTLPLTLPLAALTALYIFLLDGGSVLFVQHRRGFGGRVFRMYKFRTMYRGTGGGATGSNDKRIILGCGLIRKLRLDEVPQLYNILIGDMSLIGPRPVAIYIARASTIFEPKYILRDLMLPGITGWAQVNAGYAATTHEEIEKLAYDLYYIKHLSVDLDLQILFKTVITVLFGRGAR